MEDRSRRVNYVTLRLSEIVISHDFEARHFEHLHDLFLGRAHARV